MTAVVLAVVSAALFGTMTVLFRIGLRAASYPRQATAAAILPALAVALVAVAIRPAPVADAWPFALTGVLAPGLSQVSFTFAIAAVGASRASAVLGTAPLVAVAIAVVALHEPLSAPLLVGAVLVVAGGTALVGETGRPQELRTVGLALAALTVVLFASRDNLVRALADNGAASPETAAAATLASAALVALVYAGGLPDRATLRAFLPVGICFGVSYLLLFEAYYRGRVTVVSPLVATETLWGVGLSAWLLKAELVGRRLAVGAVLIVAGGVLIGIYR
jgi:drug/metabolite transporter (DMT)-like permease